MNPRNRKDDIEMPEADDISRLYSGVHREEPPDALDARILAQARQALEHRPKYREWFGPWQQPIAVAAVLVLSFTLLMLHQSPETTRSVVPEPIFIDEADDAVLQEHIVTESIRDDSAGVHSPERSAGRGAANETEAKARRKMISSPEAASAPVLSDEELPGKELFRQHAPTTTGSATSAPPPEFSGEAAILRETDALSKPELRLESYKQSPAVSDVEEVIVQGARVSLESEPRYRRNPEVWWKRIMKLHKQGKLDEARDEYALLQSRFPDFTPPGGPPEWY